MRNFSRAELISTLSMMLCTVENNPDMEVRKTMALSMFEVTLSYYHLLIQESDDNKLIQTCYNKAKEGAKNDHRFAKYVDKFEELTRPPPLRRSKRLANKRT